MSIKQSSLWTAKTGLFAHKIEFGFGDWYIQVRRWRHHSVAKGKNRRGHLQRACGGQGIADRSLYRIDRNVSRLGSKDLSQGLRFDPINDRMSGPPRRNRIDHCRRPSGIFEGFPDGSRPAASRHVVVEIKARTVACDFCEDGSHLEPKRLISPRSRTNRPLQRRLRCRQRHRKDGLLSQGRNS